MCCPLDSFSPYIVTKSVRLHDDSSIHLSGTVNFTPKTLSGRIVHYLQRLELAEKIAEIVDETFHLLGSTIKSFASIEVYTYLSNIHHGAHHIEHGLHAFCFLGDVSSIFTGNFFEKVHGKIDYLTRTARVCQAVSHLFASLKFLSELKIVNLGRFNPIVRYYNVLSCTGYLLSTISLLWKRTSKNFYSDLAINGCGAIFEGLIFAGTLKWSVNVAKYINKTCAVAGLIHAGSVVNRLTPSSCSIEQFIPADLVKKHSIKFHGEKHVCGMSGHEHHHD